MNFASSRKGEPVLYGVIAALTVLPFVADLLVPLGTAVWVVYVLPAALAYYVWRPQVPLAVAAAATLLVAVGYSIADPGIDPHVAATNRALGVLTCWIVGLTGFFFIRNKLAVRQQEWLQAGQVGLAVRVQPDGRAVVGTWPCHARLAAPRIGAAWARRHPGAGGSRRNRQRWRD